MQTVSQQEYQQVELSTMQNVETECANTENSKEYASFHYPHGWLGLNADNSGVCPTIDSGIWKHHTLLVEMEKKKE